MYNITPDMANRIYTILVKILSAEEDYGLRWGFCYNLSTVFPGKFTRYGFNSKVSKNLVIHDGDPIYITMHNAKPEDWQIPIIANANIHIAHFIKEYEDAKSIKQKKAKKPKIIRPTKKESDYVHA